MPVERVVLPSGAWADIATVVTFGLRRRVVQALANSRQRADLDLRLRASAELCIAMVVDWSVTAPGSSDVLPLTMEGTDLAPAADIDAAFRASVAIYRRVTEPDPKAGPSS